MLVAGNPPIPAFFPRFLAAVAMLAAPEAGSAANLALHHGYQWSRPPDYPPTTDPGDDQQLTDGVYASVSPLWKDKATVGWSNAVKKFVSVTIDLGAAQPIDEVSFSTGAGIANVSWPEKLLLYLSDEGTMWRVAGDMVQLDPDKPRAEPGAYVRHRFRARQLGGHGRFVKIVIHYRLFTFCDEIEVLSPDGASPRRPAAALQAQQSLETRDPERHGWRGGRDAAYAETIGSRIPDTPAGAQLRAELAAVLSQLATNPPAPPRGGRAILPLDDTQRRLFAVNGKALAAAGMPKLVAWKVNRYDPISPIDVGTEVQRKAPSLEIRALRGERRADAVVLVNATAQKQRIHLRLASLPESVNATLFEVPFVETTTADVAAALMEPQREAGGWTVDLDAGMSRQLWFAIQPTAAAKSGLYAGGKLIAKSDIGVQLDLPIRLHVSFVIMPRPRLHLGGWDYTDSGTAYDVGPRNRDELVRFLQAHEVDVTWAHRSTLPDPADFQDRNSQRSRDRFATLDAWLSRWPSARARFVYLAVQDDLSGSRRGTPEFQQAVSSWMKDVASYVAQKSAAGAIFGVLPVDEPSTPQQAARIEDWARAIRSASPHPVIYEDPVFATPSAFAGVLDLCDINGPSWTKFVAMSPQERAALLPKGSRELWFYETKGPIRAMDPVSYGRLAAWVAFRAGAKGIGFWSFADAGGGSSWNEYEATRGGGFAPEFLAPDGVVDSKHMMAIVEGLEDHERLSLLADRIAASEKGAAPVLGRARMLLESGPQRVLAGIDRSPDANILWDTGKDRSLPDVVANEVLDLLEAP